MDYQVDAKCGIYGFLWIKSYFLLDFRNWRTNFVVFGVLMARRSALKIFRTLSPIVKSLQNCKAERHQKHPTKFVLIFFIMIYSE